MDWLSNLLKQVAKTPIRVQNPHRGSKEETPMTATLCGNNKTQRHLRLRCPQPKRPPHFRKPGKTPRPYGPGKEQPRDGYRRASKWTPRDTLPVSGRYRDGPVDPMGNRNRSCYHSPTASVSYRKRSRPARSIWTSEGSYTPLRLRSGTNQRTNGKQTV